MLCRNSAALALFSTSVTGGNDTLLREVTLSIDVPSFGKRLL